MRMYSEHLWKPVKSARWANSLMLYSKWVGNTAGACSATGYVLMRIHVGSPYRNLYMIHNIFSNATNEKVAYALATVCSHGDHICLFLTGKCNHTTLFFYIVVN